MFIKRGDGKILSVVDEEELNEKAKKNAQKFSSDKSTQEQDEKNNSNKLGK